MNGDQVKTMFQKRGITVTQWARDNGYRRAEVYRVINGQAKCHYGKAHQIAVKLGMKNEMEPA